MHGYMLIIYHVHPVVDTFTQTNKCKSFPILNPSGFDCSQFCSAGIFWKRGWGLTCFVNFFLIHHSFLDLWVFFYRKMWEKFYFILLFFLNAPTGREELESVLEELIGFWKDFYFSVLIEHTHFWEMMCVESNTILKWFHLALYMLEHTIPGHGRRSVYNRVLRVALGTNPRDAREPHLLFPYL